MFTDRHTLRTDAYAAPEPLAARLAIYQWQQDRVDLPALAVAALRDVSGRVLDAGCGLGTYADRLRTDRPDLDVVTLDLSTGMRPDLVGDVQELPFGDNTFDAMLGMHMLYHVPDISAAVEEFRRVLRPGGLLLVSTNGPDDKLEIWALLEAAVGDAGGGDYRRESDDDRFTHLDADLLRAHFDVQIQVFERATVVPEVEPVVAFFDSLRALTEPTLPDPVSWPDIMAAVRARVTAQVAATGAWRFGSQLALLTCR